MGCGISSTSLADDERCSRTARWNLRAFKLAMGCAMLPTEIDALVRSVEPTTWSGNKTFGIDLSSDFVWIDDAPLEFEIDALRSRGLLDRTHSMWLTAG